MQGSRSTRHLLAACALVLLGTAGAAQQKRDEAASVTPGELVVEPSTLINLGFEWHIAGDANWNAQVAAIDRVVTLPNINDGFTGKAPDPGALEAGQPLPLYGPRPRPQ